MSKMGSGLDIRPGHCFDRRGPSGRATTDAIRSSIVARRSPKIDAGMRYVPGSLLQN
jgi:hypothetical protein